MRTHLSCRRMERGTYGRRVAANQGRSRWQPRSGRRAKTCGITSAPGKSAGAVETGGSGRSSTDIRDNITLAEPRTRGLRWLCNEPEVGGVDNTHHMARGHRDDEGAIKPRVEWGYAGLALELIGLSCRVGLIERRLSLKPYRGKPDVRNFREGGWKRGRWWTLNGHVPRKR